jgi:hypothetical protein
MRLVSWKTGSAIAVCAIAVVFGQIGAAQEAKEGGQPAAAEAQAPAKPAPAPAPEMPRRPMILPAVPNVRVDLTIIDQAGSETPVKKTLSVIAASGSGGSVRSKVTVAVPTMEGSPVKLRYEDLPLNVDVRPEIAENGLIRTRLILNYETVRTAAGGGGGVRSVVTVDQTMMLVNGKPMIVSQSADAATDRKVSVEMKATSQP